MCFYIQNSDHLGLCYDCILISKDDFAIPNFVKFLETGSDNFTFTDEGSLSSHLGVCKHGQRTTRWYRVSMFHPFLLDRIIKTIGFVHLLRQIESIGALLVYLAIFKVLVDLIFLWPFISVQDSATILNCLMKGLLRGLLDTYWIPGIRESFLCRPDLSKGLECYVDADFAGGWEDGDHDSPEIVLSRTGCVIVFAGCPITWGRKLQAEIALSKTEGEYIALCTAMYEESYSFPRIDAED